MEDGSEENLKIELGDHSIFPIEYSEGRAPAAEDEIALSTINADEMSKKVGDVITLVIEGKEKNLTVSGIYSDITNGGKTAKAVFTDNSADIMWSIICAGTFGSISCGLQRFRNMQTSLILQRFQTLMNILHRHSARQ